MEKKRYLRDSLFVLGSTAISLLGIGWHSLKKAEKISQTEFTNKVVFLNNQRIPLQEFYENVSYQDGYWVYKDRKGKNRKIDFISDFVHKKNKIEAKKWLKNQKSLYHIVDTIYYRKVKNSGYETSQENMEFIKGNKKYNHIFSAGLRTPHGICIRQFEPLEGEERCPQIDQFNTNLNKTEEHEAEHNRHEDPGKDLDNPTSMRQLGQSYELTFTEACWSEILANIKQLLAQHNDYMKNHQNLNKITSRFRFYRTALQKGTVRSVPVDRLSEKEVKFIADSVYFYWMLDKFPIYHHKLMSRTIWVYNEKFANYNATRENKIRHLRVMKDKCIIGGYNFYPYLIGYETEILKRITQKDKKLFVADAQLRKAKQTHLDDLESTRLEKGYQAYKQRIAQNAQAAQTIKAKNYVEEHFAQIKKFIGLSR